MRWSPEAGRRGHAARLLALTTGLWLVVGLPDRPHGRQAVARPWFEDVTAIVGIDVTHRNGARGEFRIQEIIGAGVGLIDYDNDGDLDVFLVQGAQGPSTLFRNDLDRPGGTLRFTDVTARAGIGTHGDGMGVAVGDYDGDGLTGPLPDRTGSQRALPQPRRWHVRGRHRPCRRGRPTVEHERGVRGPRRRRRSRSLRRQLPGHRVVDQALLRAGRRARLLSADQLSPGARPAVPQSRRRQVRGRLRSSRHPARVRQWPRRGDRRLRPRWASRHLRGQRRDAEPVVAQPGRRAVRGRRPALWRRVQRPRPP